MKSHIQLPHFIMRRFRRKTTSQNINGQPVHKECVYCLDIKKKEIYEADINDLNVKEDYYNDKAEKLLGDVESDFGKLIAEIKRHLKGNVKNFDLKPYEHVIKKFFYMAITRSKVFLSKAIAVSEYGEFFPEIFNPSSIVMGGEILYNDDVLSDFQAMVGVSSEKNFVVPKTCWYWGLMNTPYGPQAILTLPIMPTVAIVLIKKEIKKAIEDNGYPNILNISASAIEGANIFAMRQEMICDCEFMICARRDELEELKLKINEVAYRIILSQ